MPPRTELEPTQTPPHNLDAERAVLGSVLIDEAQLPIVTDLLTPGDFYSSAHQHIFEAILRLQREEAAIDAMTIYDELKKAGQLEEVGGLAYLSSLDQYVLTTANAAHHAMIVRQKSQLRRLIEGTQEVLLDCYREEKEPDELIEDAQRKVFEIANERMGRSFLPISQTIDDEIEAMKRRRRDHHDVTGVRTHYDHLDEMMLGLQRSDLIILAARPSMGKTAFAMNIAANVALLEEQPVGVFSLEMSAEQVRQRLLSAIARVPMREIRRGRMTPTQMQRIEESATLLRKSGIYIDDTPGLTVQEVRARARRLKVEEPNLALIIVDYIQLMRGTSRAARESRQREVAEIAGELKALARQLDIPVVALSQLSRLIEQREKTIARPKLSDLRESGALEQDADVVLFVHRDPQREPPLNQSTGDGPDEQPEPVRASVIIGKQRNGPTGDVQMWFMRQFTKFVNMDKKYWEWGDR